MKWLGNARVPAQNMSDLSDAEWYAKLQEMYGEKHVHIGPPQEGAGHTAAYWESKEVSGIYLDDNAKETL